MVRTPSMGASFMLVEYPHMSKILKATNTPSSIGETKVIVEAVGKEGEYLANGRKLPQDFSEYYRYWLEQISGSPNIIVIAWNKLAEARQSTTCRRGRNRGL